jgi:hypothetical protein
MPTNLGPSIRSLPSVSIEATEHQSEAPTDGLICALGSRLSLKRTQYRRLEKDLGGGSAPACRGLPPAAAAASRAAAPGEVVRVIARKEAPWGDPMEGDAARGSSRSWYIGGICSNEIGKRQPKKFKSPKAQNPEGRNLSAQESAHVTHERRKGDSQTSTANKVNTKRRCGESFWLSIIAGGTQQLCKGGTSKSGGGGCWRLALICATRCCGALRFVSPPAAGSSSWMTAISAVSSYWASVEAAGGGAASSGATSPSLAA